MDARVVARTEEGADKMTISRTSNQNFHGEGDGFNRTNARNSVELFLSPSANIAERPEQKLKWNFPLLF